MRLLKFFFLAIAFLTVSLAAYCFVQVPLVKKPTPSAVDFLEKNHVETTRLSELDKELVAEALRVIRSNDKAVWHAYSNVWHASVFGFLGLGVVSFVLALVAHRQTGPLALRLLWALSRRSSYARADIVIRANVHAAVQRTRMPGVAPGQGLST